MNIDDQRMTSDRPPTFYIFWKISNSHISATHYPIHFMHARPQYFALGHYTSLYICGMAAS